MSRIEDPSVARPFVPFDQRQVDDAKRVVYFVKPPTLTEQTQLQRAILEAGGRQHLPIEMFRQMKRGIQRALGDDEADLRARLLERIERGITLSLEMQDGVLGGQYAGVEGIEAFLKIQAQLIEASDDTEEIATVVADHDARFARMRADNALFPQIAAIWACKLFLRGWQNGPGKFRRQREGVPDDLIQQIPEIHRLEIAAEVRRLSSPTEAERKNSDSLSPLTSAGATSTAASPQPQTIPLSGSETPST
jgi:hypothetical protein